MYLFKVRCMFVHTCISVSREQMGGGRINPRLEFLVKALESLVSECKKWNGSHSCWNYFDEHYPAHFT